MESDVFLGIEFKRDCFVVSYCYRDIFDLVRFEGKPFFKFGSQKEEILEDLKGLFTRGIKKYLDNNIPHPYKIKRTTIAFPVDLNRAVFHEKEEGNFAILCRDVFESFCKSEFFGENVFATDLPLSASLALRGVLNKYINVSFPLYFMLLNIKVGLIEIFISQIDVEDIKILGIYRGTLNNEKSDSYLSDEWIKSYIEGINKIAEDADNFPSDIDVILLTGDLFVFRNNFQESFHNILKENKLFEKSLILNDIMAIDTIFKFGVVSIGCTLIAKLPEIFKKKLGFNLYIRLFEEIQSKIYEKYLKIYNSPPYLIFSNDNRRIYYDILIFGKDTELNKESKSISLKDLLRNLFDNESISFELTEHLCFVTESAGGKKNSQFSIEEKIRSKGISDLDLIFQLDRDRKVSFSLLEGGKVIHVQEII